MTRHPFALVPPPLDYEPPPSDRCLRPWSHLRDFRDRGELRVMPGQCVAECPDCGRLAVMPTSAEAEPLPMLGLVLLAASMLVTLACVVWVGMWVIGGR